MNILAAFYRIILDALFPLSKAEEELLLLSPEEALAVLPGAPPYDKSVVPLPDTRSIFAYKDERVSKLIWNIKYKKSQHSIQVGGYALYKNLPQVPQGKNIILAPIPITPRRRRERGYNQCELLLDEVTRLDTEKRFLFRKDLLVRVQHADRQTLKGREERLESSKGIFAVNEGVAQGLKEGKDGLPVQIIVIDDVITTGSTVKEALDVLKAAGFTDVVGLSLAH